MIFLLSMKRLSFSPVSQSLLVLAACLLVVLLAVHVYAQRDSRVSRKKRRLFVGLRIAAVLCIMLALLQCTVTLESDESLRPQVFVLLDNSASMELPFDFSSEADSTCSRADAALTVASGLLEKLGGRFESSVFVFSDSLRKVSWKPGDALPDEGGARSAMGLALEELASGVGKSPAAAVLISDGSSSFGPDPSSVAKRLQFPVYTVAAAKEGSFRDIEITGVLYPSSGYAGTEVPVLVRVKGHGFENLDVPLSISEEETVVSRGMLKLAGSAETEILLSLKPRSAGVHFYRVSVPAARGEASTVNNAVSFPLRVLSEKLKVLYLQGDLTWDFTFLKRQLESDTKLEMTFALVSGWKTKLPAVEGLVTSFPRQLEQSSVVIVGDGAAGHVGAETWAVLEKFVSSGGGLFIVGAEGLNTMPASARRVLPAQLREADSWGPAEYLSCKLTFEGLNHAICDVERDASSNADSWKEISPLQGSHVLGSAKHGSSVLIEAVRGEEHFPVVVAGFHGKGRVLLVAASGIWRWGFSLPAVGGSDRLFSRFASNAVWWLSEAEEDRSLEAGPVSWVFENGEEVVFQAPGAGEGQNPVLEVTDEAGAARVPVFTERDAADTVRMNFGTLEPGTYNYSASYDEAADVAALDGRFIVDTMGPEYRSLFPDPGLLAYVSEASGGKFFAADEVDELAREIETFGRKTTVEKQIRLWNHPLLFVIFTALIALEWWLRRRSGLP